MLIEVKLIINNAPLTYVYPSTIETYLTLNHLLFGRQLLCRPNTRSTVVRNYVVNLCETQRTSKLNINSQKNYVALVYDEKIPRHFWRIVIVTGILPSRDSETKRSDSEN